VELTTDQKRGLTCVLFLLGGTAMVLFGKNYTVGNYGSKGIPLPYIGSVCGGTAVLSAGSRLLGFKGPDDPTRRR
jgi:hypothetical protein